MRTLLALSLAAVVASAPACAAPPEAEQDPVGSGVELIDDTARVTADTGRTVVHVGARALDEWLGNGGMLDLLDRVEGHTQ